MWISKKQFVIMKETMEELKEDNLDLMDNCLEKELKINDLEKKIARLEKKNTTKKDETKKTTTKKPVKKTKKEDK